jgi:hypothetical protein
MQTKDFHTHVAQAMPFQLKNKIGGVIWLGEVSSLFSIT